MSGSTIGPVLAALRDLWVAAMPDDVQVIYGPRQTVTVTKSKVLSIGNVEFGNTPSTMDDDFPMDETYTVQCVAEVGLPGERDQQAAAEAALAVYAAAVAAVRAQPDETLGVPDVQYARLTGRGQLIHARSEEATKKGRGASVPFTITVLGVL